MDDKHLHIGDWLKKAAQQPAPDAGQELKQQAWARMAAMLDKEQGTDTQPARRQPLRRFLPRRAPLLISLGAATCALTTWFIWQASNHTAQQPTPADTATVFAGPAATAATPGSLTAGGQDTLQARLPARAASGTGTANNGMPAQLPPFTATNGAGQQAPGPAGLPGTGAKHPVAGRTAFHPSARGNISQPLSSGNGAETNPANPLDDTPIPSPAGRQQLPGARLPVHTQGRAATGGRAGAHPPTPVNNNHLQALPTINLYALQTPALAADSHRRQVPLPLSTAPPGSKQGSRRWALQAGLLYPFNGAYGIQAGLLYTFPLGKHWSLQSEVNAGFITGYDRYFEHQAVRNTRVDSMGNNITLYRKDTLTTPYTLQRIFSGAAGIHLAYTTPRVTLRTGLVYSGALPGGRKDSAITSGGAVTVDSLNLQTEFSTPAFNSGRLLGIHQLNWSVDAAYQLRPRIQAGIRYRAALLRSGGDDGFKGPARAVQDNSLLELYLRIPLGR
ncbi:DUF3575 domain-containing protein [Chitinophaga japonensis]|uniref:Uncharacterized protein n=1 Tax=Chitinophaga japonensis TaxID=104662 RepID=A0A562SYU3_CHIJA|nr:DUF3575 domain-containing protein [Chitinophaga japonensis]TWI86495.1 hypothetical protein LX66_3753 [Chitinophaga japonensis]